MKLTIPHGALSSTGGQRIGHGGAYGTNTSIDQQHRLITAFPVQHAGWPDDGNKIPPAFLKAATEAFASSPPKP